MGDLFLEKQWLQKSDVSFQYDFTSFALENKDVDNDVNVRIISSWILLFWGGAAVFCLIFTLSVLRRYNRALFLQLSSWGYKADLIYLINSTIRFQSQSHVMHKNLALLVGLHCCHLYWRFKYMALSNKTWFNEMKIRYACSPDGYAGPAGWESP